MSAAITVDCVSKMYHLGAGEGGKYGTLRDTLAGLASAPLRWAGLRKKARKNDTDEVLWALRDVCFEVKEGEVVALVGKNGAGKSTMLKILSSITSPTHGRASIRGRVGSLLEVGTGFHPELTGRENVYLNGAILGMSRKEIDRKFDAIVAFSEIERFLDTPVKRYSSGMYTRLAFSVASHLEPEILIVDEVLAVGDAAFQKKCIRRMEEVRSEGRTVLFVSHNMVAVKELCTRAVMFEKGKVVLDGDVDDVVERYMSAGASSVKPEGGVIPEGAPRLSDHPDEARIRRVRVTTVDGRDVDQLFFGQRFRVGMEVEVFKEMDDALFEVSISTADGQHVTYSATTDGGAAPLHIKPGMHEVWAEFESTLLPRPYTVDVGVHHNHDGATADYVRDTLDFVVLRVAEGARDHYRWPRTRGMVRMAGTWEVGTCNKQPAACLAGAV